MTTCKVIFIGIVLIACHKTGSAQDYTKNHRSLLSYGFDRSYMSITNEYAKDTAIKIAPNYIHYPYETRKIQVYGPTLRFTVTPNGFSSDFTNEPKLRSVGGFVMDSMFKSFIESELKKPGRYKWLSKSESDSISKNEKRFDLAGMQIRAIKNGKIIAKWKNILLLPKADQSKETSQATFIIYNDTLAINDRLVITFRNKEDTSLIQFEFQRMDNPLMPFLVLYERDTSAQSLIDFIQKKSGQTAIAMESINEFYRYWPVPIPHPGLGLVGVLNRDRIYADTKLVLTFRKPDPYYIDTTLQYVLSAGHIEDSTWQTTGHLLFIYNLKPGTDYTLLVRYKTAPANIQTYTFHTVSKWYQTNGFKVIAAIISAALILFVVVFINYVRLREEKRKNSQLQHGLKSIQAQLNPHFVFNALGSIQGLVNKNDITGANHYLTEFSMLLRESLNNSDKEMVPVNTEIRVLDTYLTLEQLRFHFQYAIEVDEAINKNAVEIPSLLLQPLVENAIKHGVALLNEKGMVMIRFQAKNKGLIISVSDNGSGFTESNTGKGFGLKLTRDRISLLNKTLKGQPIYLNIDHTQNNGTTVHLIFENWL